jgi:cytochrome c2
VPTTCNYPCGPHSCRNADRGCESQRSERDQFAAGREGLGGAREAYSGAMLRADLVWDEPNLREYLANPQAKVKGNRMAFSGLDSAKDIDDLTAYLATLQ